MEPPPEFEALYDEDILHRIDRVVGAVPSPMREVDAEDFLGEAASDGDQPPVDDVVIPRYPVARRLSVGSAMLAGAMMGVAELLEPDRAKQHIIQYSPDKLDEDGQLVTFQMVSGDPRASRLVIRPWLLDRFRRRHSG